MGLFAALVAGSMTSCVVSHTAVVTNNSVGDKTGEVKGTPFKKDLDLSYEGAMKDGGITKVGIAEMKVRVLLIIPHYKLTVTGE